MNAERTSLFSDAPVQKAVLTLAIPTVISQLITVVYNMADTFFIGKLNDPLQVAAATIAMPCFMLLTGFANLFGLGGSSLISRCLGTSDQEKARHCASFCIWTGAAVALLDGIAVVLLESVLFPILGASADTWVYCRQYAFWTIGVGAVPTVMNAELAHLIRAEGYSKSVGFGVAFGGVLNIILDPIFIFVFRLNIEGAAIATMLSNLIAMGYFLGFLYHIRKNTVITPNPKAFSTKQHIPGEVLSVGLPGLVMTMMSTISNAALNHMVAGYSDTAIAGMGIAKKIDLLAYAIAQGMTNLQTASASAHRIFDFLASEELPDEQAKPQLPRPIRGAVDFEHVRFSYPDSPDKIIIKDFSAHVAPGQKVAIVGPTGAGKTTMVNLLMRFYEIADGCIKIDGVPSQDIRREDVHKLLRDSGFPGMKVLEFAFDPREESNYLPYTYNSNSVVYVGTHDNNTVLGWIDELDEDTLEFCKKYIDSEDDIVWKLIKTAMASVSDTAIIQMQDYLELGSEARMNTPSVLGGNWQWRMGKNDLTDKLAKKIADITCTYGRYERQ